MQKCSKPPFTSKKAKKRASLRSIGAHAIVQKYFFLALCVTKNTESALSIVVEPLGATTFAASDLLFSRSRFAGRATNNQA